MCIRDRHDVGRVPERPVHGGADDERWRAFDAEGDHALPAVGTILLEEQTAVLLDASQ